MFDHFLYDEWKPFLREEEEPPHDMPKIRRFLRAFPQQGNPNEEYDRIQKACQEVPHPAPPFAVIEPQESAASSSTSANQVAQSSQRQRAESEAIDLTTTTPRGSIAEALQQEPQEEPMECD